MNIFEKSGYLFIVLIIAAILFPGISVPALILSAPSAALWLLGECATSEEVKTPKK